MADAMCQIVLYRGRNTSLLLHWGYPVVAGADDLHESEDPRGSQFSILDECGFLDVKCMLRGSL